MAATLGGEAFVADSVDDDEFVDGGLEAATDDLIADDKATPGEEPKPTETPELETRERDPETGKFVAKKKDEADDEERAAQPAEAISGRREAVRAFGKAADAGDPGDDF